MNRRKWRPEVRWLLVRPYFHGGAPGLTVGDEILPPNALPQWRGRSIMWRGGQPAAAFGAMGDTVSFTSDPAIARGYAGEYLDPQRGHINGAVYRVKPVGKTEPDPDFPFSEKVIRRAARARIIEVVEHVPVETNPRVVTRALASHFRYRDSGAPMYNDEGFIIPHPIWIEFGATRETLRALGPWMPMHLISDERFELTAPLPPLLP